MNDSGSNSAAVVAVTAIIVIAVGIFLYLYMPAMQTPDDDGFDANIDIELPSSADNQ